MSDMNFTSVNPSRPRTEPTDWIRTQVRPASNHGVVLGVTLVVALMNMIMLAFITYNMIRIDQIAYKLSHLI